VVLRSRLIQGLDVKWLPSVDPREAYVLIILRRSAPDRLHIRVAGSGKSIVWLVIFLIVIG
jgi:hypothetical protein